jgi:hypothetical protein
MATDLELLRRFEPVVRYTRGELFFPMAGEPYLRECDLWAEGADGERRMLVPRGELTVEELPRWQARTVDERLFLRYVQHPLSGIELARPGRPKRAPFSAPSRLARVGIMARLIDAGFDLSLLVRGTVPGGTVAAAEGKYHELVARADARYQYHGRVVRQAGWTICHYLFFYAMNDWRSSFAGANDHEADWEQCFVFLDEADDGTATPVWFARAAHDEVGADLRRRWDDPLVQHVGEHPVIFAGAGSHAAYIEPGEYLQEVPLRLPRIVGAVLEGLQTFWRETLRQGTRSGRRKGGQLAAVPFIDYARGDGVSIGPEQPLGWDPILIDDETPWVTGFDGLFGLDTKDRFAGERAPAGPKFNREGRPRQSWIDPVGFAALQATPPPSRHVAVLAEQLQDLASELRAVEDRVAATQTEAQELGVRAHASRRAGRSDQALQPLRDARDAAVTQLTELRRQEDEVRTTLGDTEAELARVQAGDLGDPRGHLRFVAHPQDPRLIRRSRILDVWAAISVAALLFLLALLLFLGSDTWWIGVPALIFGYVGIEALVRRRFLDLLLNVTALLAVIGALILFRVYFVQAIILAVAAIGLLILRDNVRELRASLR